MNKYIIQIDDDNNIIRLAYTFDYSEDDIELTKDEYDKAQKYRKFDIRTREFSEEISIEEQLISLNDRFEQMEILMGLVAEQLAKQSLGM